MPRTPASRRKGGLETPQPKPPNTPGSTTRKARLEEKSELQDLNKRLEFYILKQREKDANAGSIQRTISENKEYYENEIKKLKSLHETQVNNFRKQRDELDSEIQSLTEENKRQASMLKSYTSQLSADKTRGTDLEDRVSQLTEELLEAQAATAVAEADAKKSAHGLKKAESEIKHLQKELKDSQARDKDHAVELAAAQSLAKNLQDDINIMSQKASESAAKVEELESALSSTRANAEDKLRALFGAQLKEILAERQRQFDEKKAEGLQELRDSYEGKLSEANEKCHTLLEKLEEAHKAAAEAAGASSVVDTDASDAVAKVWENRIATLQNQLAEQRTQADQIAQQTLREHSKEVAALKAEIEVLEEQANSASSTNSKLATSEEENSFLRSERTKLNAKINTQKKELSKAEGQARKIAALQKQAAFLEEQCESHKQENQTLNEEYISLMDVKVGLDMEISEFRRLLSDEESRLQPQEEEPAPIEEEEDEEEEQKEVRTTNKKRGRQKASTPAPKAKRARASTAKRGKKAAVEEEEEPAKPTLIISGIDSKKWIEITNSVKEAVCLDGWSLKVVSSKECFFFPDVAPLKPGKTLKINLGSKAKKGKNAVVWAKDDIFKEEDKVYLMSPEGVGHSSVAWNDE